MSIDVIGVNPTASLISQCGLSKFIIYREGSGKGTTPVFECINTSTCATAKNSFVMWAENLYNSNPTNTTVYEIFLFDEKSLAYENNDEESESEGERPKISKKKSNKIRFRFQLSGNNSFGGMQQQIPNGNFVSRSEMGDLIAEALVKAEKVRTDNEILNRLKALEERENEEEDDDDDEEEQEFSEGVLDRVEGLFNRLEKITGMSKKKPVETIADELEEEEVPEQKAAAVNGIEDISKTVGRDVKKNINTAITKLYKYDKDLDLDLLKFAEIAETNTAQFQMFIDALRKM